MDSEIKFYRSLPPLVEGKLHGYLKLSVDEVLWSRRSPGDVTILASWWGETDSAQFRPIDVQTGLSRLDKETIETYAVRTNVDLFIEYLKNCETLELAVISEETHRVIGTSHVTDLLDIFHCKNNYSRYFPILNESGNRLGDLHISLKFLNTTKGFKSIRKMKDYQKTKFQGIHQDRQSSLSKMNETTKYNDDEDDDKLYKNNNKPLTTNDDYHKIYKSVLKDKRIIGDNIHKHNSQITDKLVSQVVDRAKKLRGAILKETYYDRDPLAISDTSSSSSLFDSSRSDNSNEANEAKLYEYFIGKKMSTFDQRKALDTLRSTSPTPSLIELASEMIKPCKNGGTRCNTDEKMVSRNNEEILDGVESKDSLSMKTKELSPLDRIDSMKIVVESLTLSPAGYRRVKSSCVSRGDSVPLSVTYFVEYDTSFTNVKKCVKKSVNESQNRATKLCSKKQVGQVIYFNHRAVFDIPKSSIQMEVPLKFKVFNRHLNQRTPSLLGFGLISVSEIAEMETLSTTQKLAIVNKGIKMGELRINIELGCDGIHFGKDFVDAVTSTNQNIPVYEISSSLPSTVESKMKSATGSNSKPNSRVSTASKYSYNCSGSRASGSNKNNVTDNQKQQSNTEDDRYVKIDRRNDNKEEKILLHGLIYIAEGKGLPKLNTYLICRAFWKEDRATSQLCNNTSNPLYQFHELVPLLHGQDLLDRTKDNFIVTEIWNRNVTGEDSLIGFTKLPLHQLYIAYRDPLVVPHLLLSKYPVISVDGWVPIYEPVTGRSCGELLALVALGTADQIALLEMTRGLRDCNITPRAIESSNKSDTVQTEQRRDFNPRGKNSYDNNPQSSINFLQEYDERSFPNYQTPENAFSGCENTRTQECQTEITTFENMRSCDNTNSENVGSQNSILHALVDHLAQALNVPKFGGNIAAETQTVERENDKIGNIIERIDSDPLSNGSVSSSESNHRENYGMPTEMYRSVGVGAEFDDNAIQVPSTSYSNSNSKVGEMDEKLDSDEVEDTLKHIDDESSFRAHVEIECALHLPMVEKAEGTIEPCTYVTFQPVQKDNGTQFGPYKVTNIFPNSCSPKWEWRCDTRLSSELLVNDKKRMILKIWRLSDPNLNSNFDLDKDIVIGFAAVDLSVLLAGFPLVSGWFHIMDFTGKCNGQIKVTITPLENISMFVKSTAGTSALKKQTSNIRSPLCIPESKNPIPQTFTSRIIEQQSSQTYAVNNTDGFVHSAYMQLDNNDQTSDIGLSLGDVSMTFLSQSLKQKLTELDEITKRLKSRLHDVTNEDFDVDFDPDFDANEPEIETERENGNKNGYIVNENSIPQNLEDWQALPPATNNSSSSHSSQVNERFRNSNFFNDIQNRYAPNNYNNTNTDSTEPNLTDTGYSTNSHVQSSQSCLSNGHLESEIHNQNGHFLNNDYSRDDLPQQQPVRGAKMHINHLLDKLTSLSSSAPPSSAKNFPIKRNIHDFIASLRHNNIHTNGKCNQEVNVRNVPTQTEGEISKNDNQTPSLINLKLNTVVIAARDVSNERNNNVDSKITTTRENSTQDKKINKVSKLIREELVTEENNDSNEFDDLTTHLLTSNVRHMDLDSIFNPLLYQHLIPDDIQSSNSLSNPNNSSSIHLDLENSNNTNSSDAVVIEELDNRYTENFNHTINNGLGRLRNLIEIDNSLSSIGDTSARENRVERITSSDNLEGNNFFRITPAGVSDHIDGNIDVTVTDKPSNDDLMASNSTESTTTLSFDTSSIRQRQELVDNVSLISSSDSSVSVVTRQAPDGGNPTEENCRPLAITSRKNESSDNSSTDS